MIEVGCKQVSLTGLHNMTWLLPLVGLAHV